MTATPGYRRRPGGPSALLLLLATWATIGAASGAEPSAQAEQAGLQDPFQGVTANGQPVFGLFPIESTGVSTAPVVAAAGTLLEALSPGQRKRARFAVDDPVWRQWSPHPAGAHGNGADLAEIGEAAHGAAMELLQASLSDRGVERVRDIMSNGSTKPGDYRITVLGEPSPNEPWGWQLEGRHLVLNYFVLGDQVVMSPVFLGWEPVAGASRAATALQGQGRAMLQGLSDAQRGMARIGASHGGNGIVAGAHGDNAVLENVGIPGSLMDDEQRSRLLELIELYVGNLREEHAALKMAEVEARLDDTYFAWLGGREDDALSYYRIFSPVILIEFEWQAPAADRPAHIHAVMRTPNGNDYGKAFLSRHLAEHPHE